VTRTAPACTDCGLCSKVCPASLPVHRLGRVRSDECTGCVECVRVCPAPGALAFSLPAVVPEKRRSLSPARVALAAAILFFLPLGAAKLAVCGSRRWGSPSPRADPEIESPIYTHARGSAPVDLGESPADPR